MKLEGKNLLYTVMKCRIATEGNKFDKYICPYFQGSFQGALNHAFGNRAELDIKKLISRGTKDVKLLSIALNIFFLFYVACSSYFGIIVAKAAILKYPGEGSS